jgi:hypothetical protein
MHVKGVYEIGVPIHKPDDLPVAFRDPEFGTPLTDVGGGPVFVAMALNGGRRQFGKPRAHKRVMENCTKCRRIAFCGATNDHVTCFGMAQFRREGVSVLRPRYRVGNGLSKRSRGSRLTCPHVLFMFFSTYAALAARDLTIE